MDIIECFNEEEESIDCPLSQQELVDRVNAQLYPGSEPWWFEETGDKEIDNTATDATLSFGPDPTTDDVELIGKACYDTFIDNNMSEDELRQRIA